MFKSSPKMLETSFANTLLLNFLLYRKVCENELDRSGNEIGERLHETALGESILLTFHHCISVNLNNFMQIEKLFIPCSNPLFLMEKFYEYYHIRPQDLLLLQILFKKFWIFLCFRKRIVSTLSLKKLILIYSYLTPL